MPPPLSPRTLARLTRQTCYQTLLRELSDEVLLRDFAAAVGVGSREAEAWDDVVREVADQVADVVVPFLLEPVGGGELWGFCFGVWDFS